MYRVFISTRSKVELTFCSSIKSKNSSFTLGSSPAKEAKEIMKSLRADDVDTVKLATFSLKLLLKDREFLNHFIKLGGFFVLQEIILISDSNTLAYSLLALQTLLILQLEIETEAAGGLDNTFYSRLVEIIGIKFSSSRSFFDFS